MLLTGFTIKLQYRGNSLKVKIFLTIQRHSSKSPKYFSEINFCLVLTSGTAAFTFSIFLRTHDVVYSIWCLTFIIVYEPSSMKVCEKQALGSV